MRLDYILPMQSILLVEFIPLVGIKEKAWIPESSSGMTGQKKLQQLIV